MKAVCVIVVMNAFRLSVAFLFQFLVISLHAQRELMPGMGSSSDDDGYGKKIQQAFSEAYDEKVELRAVYLPSFFPETVLFLNEKGKLVTLEPLEISIWSFEQRELIRNGTIRRTDADGREMPPDEESEYTKNIPENISDLVIVRRSRQLPPELLKLVREVWRDALLNSKENQEPTDVLDGYSAAYSMRIGDNDMLSGFTRTPVHDSIPSALNEVFRALIKFVSQEVNETHVAVAIWEYKVATKQRREGMAEISIDQPPKIIPSPSSVRLTDRIILREFSAENVSMDEAVQTLTAKFAMWAEYLGYEKIGLEAVRFSAAEELGKLTVNYKTKDERVKFICEVLAEQVGAELEEEPRALPWAGM